MGTGRRLLLATIGGSDPATEHGPKGALRAAIQDHPELVFLVHTNATLTQAEETRDHIVRAVPRARVHLLHLPNEDPTDIETMLDFLQRRWVELRRELAGGSEKPLRSEDVQVFVCGSSGTPQMGLALTLSTDLAFPWAQHWTAIHPTGAPGQATPPSSDPCLRPFRTGLLRHDQEARDGFRLLAGCRFHEATAKFDERLSLVLRPGDADSLAPIRIGGRLALAFRDLADSSARTALQRLFAQPALGAYAERLCAPKAITTWLRRVEAWFAPIERAIHTPNDLEDPWPAELVAVALRERAAGRLPLAVTRLQTALEVAMQIRLTQLSGRPSAHGRDTWEHILDRIRRQDARLDSHLAVPTDQLRAAVVLARARNDLAHRGRTQHDLDDVLANGHHFVDDLLVSFGWHASADAPTQPQEIRALAALLADWSGLPLEG